MNRCSNCGKLVPAGVMSCQNCGMPLTVHSEGAIPGMKMGQQSELPAWLESLRANERPGSASGGGQGGQAFSTADLVDDGALPGWMRSDNAEMENTSGQYPAWRPASTPAPTTDDQPVFSRGFEARSLIDEQSLPSWMQGGQDNSQQVAQRNIPAQSLVQPDSLPDWMKNLQQPSQPMPPVPTQPPYAAPAPGPRPPQAAPQPAPASFFDNTPAAPPDMGQSSRMAASSLLDMNALPTWMREGEQSSASSAPAYQAPQGFQPAGPMPVQGGPGAFERGMAASSLIDTNALPDWMRNADSQPGAMSGQGSGRVGGVGGVMPGGPMRAENMRVPSRPRGEVSPQEQSEIAANVFSSMLGVAASTPSFQPQPQENLFGSQAGLPQPGLPGQAGMSASMPPFAGSVPGMQPGMGGTGNTGGLSSMQSGYAGNMGGYALGMQAPANAMSMPGVPGNLGMSSNEKPARPPKAKKGFFDAIRDFFFNK